jgi:hypothetical protein
MERRYYAGPIAAAPLGMNAPRQPHTWAKAESHPLVRSALTAPGQSLDGATRTFMESRFGYDFSQVRVHTDANAAESTRAVHAQAYTVGNDVVFGAGRYSPATSPGRTLLAHELAHVVQQSRGGGLDAEPRADAAAQHVTRGEPVTREMVGGASRGLHAQADEEERRRVPVVEPPFSVSWDPLLRAGAFQLPSPTLTIPSLRPPTLGIPALTPPLLAPPSLTPPTLTPPTLTPSTRGFGAAGAGPPALTPPFTPPSQQTATATPEPPSRLPLLSRGQFSLGLRLGFPASEARDILGAPPSALQEALRRAEIMNHILTGTVPSGWEVIDKAKLASAVWGIFSTHFAPDLARRISQGLTVPSGRGGTSLELDLVLLTDFSGGGLSFTIRR